MIIKSTFQRENLFDVPEVKKDDIADYSSNESFTSSSHSDSDSKSKPLSEKSHNIETDKIDEIDEKKEEKTASSSDDSDGDDDNMKPGYLSDENETNAKNIRRNTFD